VFHVALVTRLAAVLSVRTADRVRKRTAALFSSDIQTAGPAILAVRTVGTRDVTDRCGLECAIEFVSAVPGEGECCVITALRLLIALGTRRAAVQLVRTADAAVIHAAGIAAARQLTAGLLPFAAKSILADVVRFRGIGVLADVVTTVSRGLAGPGNGKRTAAARLLFHVALVAAGTAVSLVRAAHSIFVWAASVLTRSEYAARVVCRTLAGVRTNSLHIVNDHIGRLITYSNSLLSHRVVIITAVIITSVFDEIEWDCIAR